VSMAAPTAATLPLGDLAEVLGSLYAIEDSALVGRVIAPQLKSTLGLAQGRGASYFHGFGGETGVMWNNFRVLASLEIGESSRETVRACKSAKRTFDALIELFAPLASAPEPAPATDGVPQQIAPALLRAFGVEEEEQDTQPVPLDDEADVDVDLPVEDIPDEVVLPLDDVAGSAAVTMSLRP
jgi:hypothetical protein